MSKKILNHLMYILGASNATFVSFTPYFRLLVFGILVTLVAWFSFRFFPSSPSCLAKCKQRLRNIFLTLLPKVTKNKKWKMGWTKQYMIFLFFYFRSYRNFVYFDWWQELPSWWPQSWISPWIRGLNSKKSTINKKKDEKIKHVRAAVYSQATQKTTLF